MNVQWYPGHMTKARRMMQENIKLIDLIIELVDARAPLSSRNPDIDELGKGRARLILLNKADLASEQWNRIWADWFRKQGFYVVKLDSRSRAGMKEIQNVIREACREKIERDRKRGILNRPGHGRRHSQCGEIHVYQQLCREGVYEDGQPARCDQRRPVDPAEPTDGASGYPRDSVAEI